MAKGLEQLVMFTLLYDFSPGSPVFRGLQRTGCMRLYRAVAYRTQGVVGPRL